MKMLLVFGVVLLAFSEMAQAGRRSKCDVVISLRIHGVQNSEIRDWLCLVEHESNYTYDVTNNNSNGSKDYGIYQLNDKYCGRGSTKYTQCWQINTYGCGVDRCTYFLNVDINWDTECAVKIKRCNGFSKWYGWLKNCKGRNLSTNSDYDFNNCLTGIENAE